MEHVPSWVCTRCHSTGAEGSCAVCGCNETVPASSPRGARILSEAANAVSDATTIDLPAVSELRGSETQSESRSEHTAPTWEAAINALRPSSSEDRSQAQASSDQPSPERSPAARADGSARGVSAATAVVAPASRPRTAETPIHIHVAAGASENHAAKLAEAIAAIALLVALVYFAGRYHFCFGGNSDDDFLVRKDSWDFSATYVDVDDLRRHPERCTTRRDPKWAAPCRTFKIGWTDWVKKKVE